MANGTKVLYNLRNIFLEKTGLSLLNAIVINHLQYSATLVGGIRENLVTTLEKQQNWGIKSLFQKNKI